MLHMTQKFFSMKNTLIWKSFWDFFQSFCVYFHIISLSLFIYFFTNFAENNFYLHSITSKNIMPRPLFFAPLFPFFQKGKEKLLQKKEKRKREGKGKERGRKERKGKEKKGRRKEGKKTTSLEITKKKNEKKETKRNKEMKRKKKGKGTGK